MILLVKKCVRCGKRLTTGDDIHAEHRPKDKRAVNEYVVWDGDCYPVKNEPIPAGEYPTPEGLKPIPEGFEFKDGKLAAIVEPETTEKKKG